MKKVLNSFSRNGLFSKIEMDFLSIISLGELFDIDTARLLKRRSYRVSLSGRRSLDHVW